MDYTWLIIMGVFVFCISALLGTIAGHRLNREEKAETEKYCANEKKKIDEYCVSQKETCEKNIAIQKTELENSIYWKQAALEKRIASENQAIRVEYSKLNAEKSKLEQDRNVFQSIVKETAQGHPELSKQIADAEFYLDLGVAAALIRKRNPALKAAEDVKRISAEKRAILKERKILEYQLHFYETLFPWLEEFKEVSVQDAISYAKQSADDDYDAVRNWLSPEEYQKLTDAEKFQLALNRWKERKKTAWDIGIEFERHIGYLLEVHGYQVKYVGAIMGVEDMGRDLIATKNGVSLVIQCKRWAKEKTIHEKHICQLYGSVAVLASQNPGKKYKGVFITTTNLSDTAKVFARYSNIAVVENCTYSAHPLIKCNISKSGEKIYHLPFDQQYDRTEISGKSGAFYAWTVKEAEAKGFRRAYRWRPDGK